MPNLPTTLAWRVLELQQTKRATKAVTGHRTLKRNHPVKRMFQRLSAISLVVSVLFISLSSSAWAGIRSKRVSRSAVTPAIQETQTDRKTRIDFATAALVGDGVLVQWRTTGEIDSLGFYVYRMERGLLTTGTRIDSVAPLSKTGAAPAGGKSYQWFDAEGTADTVYYIASIAAK